MQFSFRSAAVLLVGLVGLAACSDGQVPLEPGGVLPPDEPLANSSPLVCQGDVAEAQLICSLPEAAQDGPSLALVIGEQGTYVQVTSSNITVAADTFAFDVTIQNLIHQAMGTLDGDAPHPDGVRVFFHVLPTVTSGSGSITVANPTGLGTFTQTSQPYYQYDGVLQPDSVTDPLNWKLQFDPGVENFVFTLFVSTEVEHTENWVDLAATPEFVSEGQAVPIPAVVRTRVGRLVPEAVIDWSSSDTTIATVDENGLMTPLSPGRVTVFASHSSDVAEATFDICPALEVGEVFAAAGPLANEICLGGQDIDAEFTYIPMNPSMTTGLSLETTATGTQGVTGPPTPFRAPSTEVEGLSLGGATAGSAHFASLEQNRGLVASRAPLANLSTTRPGSGPSRVIMPGVPTVGDIWSLNVEAGCTGTPDLRGARVRAVGASVIIVADTLNPSTGFSQAQYDSIALELDSIAVPAITDNFGDPTDLDGNSRIVAFFTSAINELTTTGGTAPVRGKFETRDLYSSTEPDGCSRSNEGEIIYLMVPDIDGEVNGLPQSMNSVRRGVVRTFGHELQHLVNASRRIHLLNAPLEEPWLDEGLSHIAEELMFYRTSFGLAPGHNIAVTDVTEGPDAEARTAAFNTFATHNITLLRGWLMRSDTTGAFRPNETSDAARGALWAFLRYAADRAVPSANQEAFWSSLISSSTGMSNLEATIGTDPMLWYRDFTVAMYADDAVATSPEYTQPSWDIRSVFIGLQLEYPLTARPINPDLTYTIFYPYGGGTAYIRFGIAAESFGRVIASTAGAPPIAPYHVAIIRTK